MCVSGGVKYTPCMREDHSIAANQKRARDAQQGYGCCVQDDMQCGMLNVSRCDRDSWAFYTNVTCENIPGCLITLRPCCYNVEGDCAELTKDHCSAVKGNFHGDKQICREVNCLEDACGMGGFSQNIPNQWWRLFTPIFMHVGVIHLVFNLMFQMKVCAEIESFAGPWRTGLVYMLSGISGVVFGSVFTPNGIASGCSGALYGMLGVVSVDLFQSWQLIPRSERKRQTFSLLFLLLIMLAVGTLPWIDNWAHVGGFIMGIAGGVGIMPYIHFGKWDMRRKFVFKFLALAALVVGSLSGLVVFYVAPDPNFCSWCQYVDCVPYTPSLCDSTTHNN